MTVYPVFLTIYHICQKSYSKLYDIRSIFFNFFITKSNRCMSKANFTPLNGKRAELSRSLGYNAFFVNLLLSRNAVIPLYPSYTKGTTRLLIGCLSFILFFCSSQNTFAAKSSVVVVYTDVQKNVNEVKPANDYLVSCSNDCENANFNPYMLQTDLCDIVLNSCLTSKKAIASQDVSSYNQSNCMMKLYFDSDIYFFECKTDIQNEQSFLNFK